MLSRDEQTIIAHSTPHGSGALALVRLSGNDAISIAERMSILASGKLLSECISHTIHHGTIVDTQGITLDSVMIALMHGPKTFTGQNTVEITCHNNPFLIDSIVETAIQYGARLAQAGEFSQRAYLNNKIDLLQAEAIHELIGAHNQQALKASLGQLQGTFSSWVEVLEKQLLTTIALSEASFEFLDDEGDFKELICKNIDTLIHKISELKKNYSAQNVIKEGIRIALLGSVNVGKSSLFNVLLEQKRSIVNAQAGTTRDSIEAGQYRWGSYITFVDTAGLRITDNSNEREGIERSYQEAHKADVILLVIDATRTQTGHEQQIYANLLEKYRDKIITVYNKADIVDSQSQNNLLVSTVTRHNIDRLLHALEKKITELCAQYKTSFLVNKRQYLLMLRLEEKLKHVMSLTENIAHYELISLTLKDALEDLKELTGKSISEAALNAVFETFCVGK